MTRLAALKLVPDAAPIAPLATVANLSTRAMEARITIKQWSATRLDKKVTDKATADHNAQADSGRFNKRLISKNALAAITKAAGEARSTHYKRTSPWQDDGTRILTAKGFEEYAAEMQKIRLDFESAVADFVRGYPEFVLDARLRLGAMFNENDYPDAAVIKGRFKFDVKYEPLASSSDFRVAMSETQAADIRADIEARTRDAIADAMRDVWQRVAEHVGHMAGKLREFKPAQGKGDKSEGVFRDSLVENVRELTGLLDSLNITGDPKLAAIAARMSRELCGHDAADLRESDAIRETVADKAEAILNEVSEYLA